MGLERFREDAVRWLEFQAEVPHEEGVKMPDLENHTCVLLENSPEG